MNQRRVGWIESDCDDLDWKMLELLQANARQSFADIGRQVSLSAPAAAERMHRLEDRGVIRGYYADIDPHCTWAFRRLSRFRSSAATTRGFETQ